MAMRAPGLKQGVRDAAGAGAQTFGISKPYLLNFIHAPETDETDAARAREYALLSALLRRAPDSALLARLAALPDDNSPLGLAHAALAEAADGSNAEMIGREFFNLFTGVGRGELVPYGSY